MVTLIEQLITKMGINGEPMVLEKTTELVRLLTLRSVNLPPQINEYGKIVLCADIAASCLSIDIDQEQALKISGLRKAHYVNNKRFIEKLLELNRLMGVNEICIQLGVNEARQKANELHELYKRVTLDVMADIDISHPQYAAMAVYYSCKMLKKKVAKSKIMSYSNLRPLQWHALEQRWQNVLSKHYANCMKESTITNANIVKKTENCSNVTSTKECVKDNMRVEIEDYEIWKSRMLTIADNNLKQQLQMEKENVI